MFLFDLANFQNIPWCCIILNWGQKRAVDCRCQLSHWCWHYMLLSQMASVPAEKLCFWFLPVLARFSTCADKTTKEARLPIIPKVATVIRRIPSTWLSFQSFAFIQFSSIWSIWFSLQLNQSLINVEGWGGVRFRAWIIPLPRTQWGGSTRDCFPT